MPRRLLGSFLWLVLGLAVLVLAARLTMIRWWRVPLDDVELAASVAPTLAAGDWVVLWRLSPPGFGDLVLCPDPDEPTEPIIGRIAAEGGDVLTVEEDGLLVINGVRVGTEGTCTQRRFEVPHPSTGDPVELSCELELLGGVRHERGRAVDAPLRPHAQRFEVDEGHVFLVSDNRHLPFDSRHFGALERSSCRERILFRLVSKDGFFDVERRLSLIH